MGDMIVGIVVGAIFALGGLVCLGLLIGIGYISEWYERKTK